MATLEQIKELIPRVFHRRQEANAAQAAYDLAFAEWEMANVGILNRRTLSMKDVADVETELREAVVEYFEATGDKTLPPGVGIRLMRRVEYDEDTALMWAVEHKMALQLDKKAFEKLILTGVVQGRIIETPTATIATDLAKVLGEKANGNRN